MSVDTCQCGRLFRLVCSPHFKAFSMLVNLANKASESKSKRTGPLRISRQLKTFHRQHRQRRFSDTLTSVGMYVSPLTTPGADCRCKLLQPQGGQVPIVTSCPQSEPYKTLRVAILWCDKTIKAIRKSMSACGSRGLQSPLHEAYTAVRSVTAGC